MSPSPGPLARRLVRVGRRAAGRVAQSLGQALPAQGRGPGPRLVRDSGLFDAAYYLARNPDVAGSRVDPLLHYLRHGFREGRDPHPLFDTSYYLARNPDVAASGVNPLLHYLRSGALEGRNPHPLFNTAYYLAENPEVARAHLNPLVHFLRQGQQAGRRSHPWVDPAALSLADGPFEPRATLEFVPAHVLVWTDGCARVGRRVAEGQGPLDYRPLPVGRSLAFSIVIPSAEVEECRLGLEPGRVPQPVDVEVEVRTGLSEEAGEPPFRTIVPLTQRDEQGWLRIDLRGCQAPVGRRVLVRLTPRGPAGAELALVGREAWTGRLVGQRVFLEANPGGVASGEPGPRRPLTVVLSPGAGDARTVQAFLAQSFPETPAHYVLFDSAYRLWPVLSTSEVVAFASPWQAPGDLPGGMDELTFALHLAGVVTILVDPDRHGVASLPDGVSAEGPVRRLVRSRAGLAARFHYAVALGPGGIGEWSAAIPPPGSSAAALARGGLADLRRAALASRQPHVAIVSVLYRKADVITTFLEMVLRQAYRGPITVVLVDDASPDDGVARAETFRRRRDADWPAHLSLRVIRNEENRGNCASRNRGLGAVAADIYIVIDADCLMNRDFVAAHVDEHALPSTGAVCGPLNIESRDRDPVALVHHLETHPDQVTGEAELQDDVQPNGFVNCITRNFSIHRRHLPAQGLFDEAFSYSARPDSGFGWEDVEMGYRLYRAGVPIVFTPRAFAVHASHAPLMPEARQSVEVARNFERLFTTHPDMELVARRWAAGTAGRIEAWAAKHGQADHPAVARVRARFEAPRERLGGYLRAASGQSRRLRILTYRWHAAHQYELYKLPHDFSLVTELGESMTDEWPYEQRPLRSNVRMVPASRVRPQDYDLAILHFDENSLFPDLGHGVLTGEWGLAFRHFVQEVHLPRVAICHGTPQFVGQYGLARTALPKIEVHERERGWLVEALASMPVVVNSWQALDEWGFARGRVIWHGFDPQEFPPATLERQVLSHGEDWWRPHYRGAHALARIRELLGPEVRIEGPDHPVAVLRPRRGNAFAAAQFRAYVDRIRSFTVYLNTTMRSPMPRSRGEAMMCGVIPVALRNHDVEHFIRHGVSGFYGDSPEELAEYVRFLVRHPEAAGRASAAARRTALDVFNHDRYLAEWTALLGELAGGH